MTQGKTPDGSRAESHLGIPRLVGGQGENELVQSEILYKPEATVHGILTAHLGNGFSAPVLYQVPGTGDSNLGRV
ncbi:hypothetical protein N7517_000665 [Penicillium concentricum]|uniref:Uncharacterized protein n=1 Tax=Penicillium concentricum TaxID=293559 RepID=A0A9W9SS11_9EURO|nr:uncharacterized protein N7517_000665 [Penicillium concentricum]KAJ5382754.1 hypothetical protein N7517_000665 [Penicillium concentricum]